VPHRRLLLSELFNTWSSTLYINAKVHGESKIGDPHEPDDVRVTPRMLYGRDDIVRPRTTHTSIAMLGLPLSRDNRQWVTWPAETSPLTRDRWCCYGNGWFRCYGNGFGLLDWFRITQYRVWSVTYCIAFSLPVCSLGYNEICLLWDMGRWDSRRVLHQLIVVEGDPDLSRFLDLKYCAASITRRTLTWSENAEIDL